MLDHDAVGLRGDRLTVDALQFASLANSADVFEQQQAIALYRGEFPRTSIWTSKRSTNGSGANATGSTRSLRACSKTSAHARVTLTWASQR